MLVRLSARRLSKLLPTDQLAGVALVFPIVMLMAIMSNGGIGSGLSSAVARAIGAGRFADANALLLHALALAVMLEVTFTISALGVRPMLYRALGGNGPVLDAALTTQSSCSSVRRQYGSLISSRPHREARASGGWLPLFLQGLSDF